MFMKRVFFALLFLAVVGGGALYLEPWKRFSGEYTVYVSAPMALESSTIIVNSYKLALQSHSAPGSRKINLVIMDDGGEDGGWLTEKEIANAERAASDPAAIAYFGPINSGAAKVSMPILNRAGMVQVSPSATWPGLTKSGFTPGEPGIFYPTGKRHFVRVCTTDDVQGPAAARWAKKLGFDTVYVVDDGETYGVGITQLFKAEAEKIGLTILGRQTIENEAGVIRQVSGTIIKSGASLVYYGGITPNGGPELLRSLRDMGTNVPFMGPDGIFENDFITRAGPDLSSVYLTAVGAPPEEFTSAEAGAYVTNYQNAFGGTPDVFGALAYESMRAFLDALSSLESTDRESVRTAVLAIRDYPGMFGTWSFTEEGDTTQILVSGHTVSDNQTFAFLEILK
jgi:branched-chain amino acid transport system substrate-binding protein